VTSARRLAEAFEFETVEPGSGKKTTGRSQRRSGLLVRLEFHLPASYVCSPDPNDAAIVRTASHWSFPFGPSITIGNVGTDL